MGNFITCHHANSDVVSAKLGAMISAFDDLKYDVRRTNRMLEQAHKRCPGHDHRRRLLSRQNVEDLRHDVRQTTNIITEVKRIRDLKQHLHDDLDYRFDQCRQANIHFQAVKRIHKLAAPITLTGLVDAIDTYVHNLPGDDIQKYSTNCDFIARLGLAFLTGKYDNNWVKCTTAGDEENVSAISVDDVLRYYKRMFVDTMPSQHAMLIRFVSNTDNTDGHSVLLVKIDGAVSSVQAYMNVSTVRAYPLTDVTVDVMEGGAEKVGPKSFCITTTDQETPFPVNRQKCFYYMKTF